MKYGIAIGMETSPSAPLVLGGDFVESMTYAAGLGFHVVEIHVPDPDVLDPAALVPACQRLGIGISTIGTGGMYGREGLSLIDESVEKQAIIMERLHRFVDKAALLGSAITVGSIKGNIPKGRDRAPFFDMLAENVRAIAEYAEEKNVTILLEATNRLENNLLNTGRDVREFIERYELPNTRILVDSFHINIEEASIENCLKDTGNLLGYIHFADNTRRYPGAGCFRFEILAHAIREYGYDGILSVECLPLPDSRTAAEASIRFFKTYFG